MGLNLESALDHVKSCKYLPEDQLVSLCKMVTELLLEESGVQPVSTPVTICGDIHGRYLRKVPLLKYLTIGQFYDVLQLFETGGPIPDVNYVFMGDFVDRGYYSLETFTLLLLLKVRWPDRITMLRGNHESRQITQVYGFYDECQIKYGGSTAWKHCAQVFDMLTLAAIIDGRILCVHGGLSPELKTLDQIRTIERVQEVPNTGGFCDLLWSDPDDIESWAVSPRGSPHLVCRE